MRQHLLFATVLTKLVAISTRAVQSSVPTVETGQAQCVAWKRGDSNPEFLRAKQVCYRYYYAPM